jgi:hypothetical protein
VKKIINESKSKKVKRGKAVLRVSTDIQALTQHGSLEAQKQRIERWKESRSLITDFDHQIVGWVKEEQSAFREKNSKRLQMMELMKEMENGSIDFIAFESVSRLFRAVDYATKFIRLAEFKGIEVWEIESGLNYNDPGNPFIYQLFIMKAASSETESVITSHRVKTRHREAMVGHGKDPSPRASFLGLDLHSTKVGFYTVNQDELKVVVDIMKAFVQFKNYPETIEYCSEKDYRNKFYFSKQKVDKEGNIIPPKKKGGKLFDQASLRAMLTNPRYQGQRIFRDKINQFPKLQDENGIVCWEYAHGRVIDQTLLNQVQATIPIAGFKKRPRKTSTREFSLLGGIVSDSDGHPYHCQSAKDHQYRYYFNAKTGHRVSMDEFDLKFIKLLESYGDQTSAVVDVLDEYVLKLQREVASYGQQVADIAMTVEKRKQELDQLNLSKRQKLIEGAESKVILSFDEEVKKIEIELMQLSNRKIEINSKKEAAVLNCNADYIKKNFALVVEEIKKTKGNPQRLLIKSLVKRITLESDSSAKVVFNSNYLISPRTAEPGGHKVAGMRKWWDK